MRGHEVRIPYRNSEFLDFARDLQKGYLAQPVKIHKITLLDATSGETPHISYVALVQLAKICDEICIHGATFGSNDEAASMNSARDLARSGKTAKYLTLIQCVLRGKPLLPWFLSQLTF